MMLLRIEKRFALGALATLLLMGAFAWTQALPAKYVSSDGSIALFLEETAEGLSASLLLGYGLLLPLEAQLAEGELTGRFGDELEVEGVLEGDALRLSLLQGGERQTFLLTRQQGKADFKEDSALLEALSLVPDTAAVRQGAPVVSFVDFRAAFADLALAPQTQVEFAAMTPESRTAWLSALQRLHSGPADLLQYALPMIESMPDLLGFAWFEIERALSYGAPPYTGTLLAVKVDPERLAEILSQRAFERAPYKGVIVWRRQEDAETDLARREPGDPFVGPLGMAARIAVLPGYLANARFSSLTHTVIYTFRGSYPSLAQALEYRALAEAVTSGEGVLVQTQFFSPLAVGYLADDSLGFLLGEKEPSPTEEISLPPYGLAALADKQEGPDQVNLIALVYGDAETAERAAAALRQRLEGWPRPQSGEVLESADRSTGRNDLGSDDDRGARR